MGRPHQAQGRDSVCPAIRAGTETDTAVEGNQVREPAGPGSYRVPARQCQLAPAQYTLGRVPGGTAKRSRLAVAGLPAVGLALLLAAWVVATQPWQAPDEASHYQRAMSIANGRILGPKLDYTTAPGTPTQLRFIDHDTRGVMMPARLSPPNVLCMNGKPDVTGSCMEEDPNGNFPPLVYFLPAAALGVSHDASTAIWLARVVTAITCVAFLLIALALMWDGTGWSVLGLLAATTPMVLFTSSIMNSSGPQIASCIAFSAAILRITRSPERTSPWVWTAFIVAGVVAILGGPIGLEFAVVNLALFGVLLGRRGIRELRISARLPSHFAASILLAAGVLALVYSRIAGFAPTIGISPFLGSLHQGIQQLPGVLRDAVGDFGSLTVLLPPGADWVWWLLVVALVIAALRLGDLRDRLLMVAVVVVALAFPVLFYAWVDRFTGFGLQGREVLPALLLIPLVAGELVCRRIPPYAHRQSAQLALGGALALTSVFQAYAWWYNGRKVSTASGFYLHATWTPPLGWLPWAVIVGVGTSALLGFALSEGAGAVRFRRSLVVDRV